MTRRSLLFSPGDRPELLRKATRSGADVVCFDLEDAVAPDRKREARNAIADVLTDPAFDPDAEVCVRLTATDQASDLDALAEGKRELSGLESSADGSSSADMPLDAIMVPKVETAKRVETVAAMCAERELDVHVFTLIETAEGVLSARSIAGADPTEAVLFGGEDFAADVGATRTSKGEELQYARQHVVIAASAAGVDAIDTVFTDFSDEDGLRKESATAVQLGYDGKIAIHPAQVPVINEAYTPDPDRIAWAERVIDARNDASEEDRGVINVDGEMIDAPLIAQAERVIERAQAAGIR